MSSFLSIFYNSTEERELKVEGSLENVTASYQFTLSFSWDFSEDEEVRGHIWLQGRKTLLQFVLRSVCNVCFHHN